MRSRILGAAALVLVAAMSACGGGSDEGTPSSVAPKSGVFVGAITGFGSVIVNGIRFDDSGAAVTINDLPGTTAQLKVGMVVSIEGTVNPCPNADVELCTGVASRIRFRNNLEGPITTVNRLTNTIEVMGRLVEFDAATIVEGVLVSGIDGLAVGDMVTVSGLQEPDRIRARLVERTGTYVPGATPMQVYGTVANLNTVQGTCTVDGVPVSFQGLPPSALPPGGLADGQYVEATGTGNGDQLMTADRIRDRDRIGYPDDALVQIEGFVSSYVSASSFVVAGQQVDAGSAMFVNGTAADLKDGLKVEVEGTMSGTLLIAAKVIVRLEANAQTVNLQITAPIQSKAEATASFTVLGQSVKATPLTQFIDRTGSGGSNGNGFGGAGGPPSPLGYADLTVGDRVDVMAYRDASGALVATRVERTNPDETVAAKGPVDAKTPLTGLVLFGIEVSTGVNSRYRDIDGNLINDAAFYALVQVPPAVPSIVRAQGIASAASASRIDATRTLSTRGEVEIAK